MNLHLVTEPVRYQLCRGCGRHVLRALAGGLDIRADPENLDLKNELAARLAGRATYDIHAFGLPRRMYFEWRSIDRIRAPRKYLVVADHACPAGNKDVPARSTDSVEITIPVGQPQPEREEPLF